MPERYLVPSLWNAENNGSHYRKAGPLSEAGRLTRYLCPISLNISLIGGFGF